MRINKSERIIPTDIDDTLILSYNITNAPLGRKISVYDAVTKSFITMVAHEPNIRLVIEEHHRGACIKVWSRSGYEWAANVIKALDLEKYVDEVLSKPLVYIDDTPVEQWMKDRIYLQPSMQYKR